MTIIDSTPQHRPGRLSKTLRFGLNVVVGTLLAQTLATSILLLGWLMRQSAEATNHSETAKHTRIGWIFGQGESQWLTRLIGELAANIKAGVISAIGIFLVTLPFWSLWTVSWWAGWENSFNKGYEQALVGPFLGFGGVALFLIIMPYFPAAIAHQAAEGRLGAVFDIRRIRQIARHAGWRYVALTFTTVFFALPVFAGRGLMAFAYNIIPGIEQFSPEQITNLATILSLIKGAYLVVALLILRRWGGRIYARARRSADTSHGTSVIGNAYQGVRFIVLAAVWFGLVAQIFIGQFLNYDWYIWMAHPFILLPVVL
jgi:hypothetical protein